MYTCRGVFTSARIWAVSDGGGFEEISRGDSMPLF